MPPQLMLFWLLSSSRKDKMAVGFEIEYCMIGPASCMVVKVDCCMLGWKSYFCPYNRCPGAVKSYHIDIRKVWLKTLEVIIFKKGNLYSRCQVKMYLCAGSTYFGAWFDGLWYWFHQIWYQVRCTPCVPWYHYLPPPLQELIAGDLLPGSRR